MCSLVGPRVLNLTQLPAAPSIVPPDDGSSAYLIVMKDESHSFHDFSDFTAEPRHAPERHNRDGQLHGVGQVRRRQQHAHRAPASWWC